MGDLDGRFPGRRVVVERKQPGGPIGLDGVRRGDIVEQLRPQHTATSVFGALAEGDQADEEASDGSTVLHAHVGEDLLGPCGQRTGETTEIPVGGERQRRAVSAVEQLREGELQEWQGARLGCGVAD